MPYPDNLFMFSIENWTSQTSAGVVRAELALNRYLDGFIVSMTVI